MKTPGQRAAAEAEAARQELRDPKPDRFADSVTVLAVSSTHDSCLGEPPVNRIVLLSGTRRLEASETVSVPSEYSNKLGARFTFPNAIGVFDGTAFQTFAQDGPFDVAIVREGQELLKTTIKPWAPTTCSLSGTVKEVHRELKWVTIRWMYARSSSDPDASYGHLETLGANRSSDTTVIFVPEPNLNNRDIEYPLRKAPYEVTVLLKIEDCTASATLTIPTK